MNEWLAAFAYKTEISFVIMLAAGVITAITAMLAVSYQSIQAALMNPVEGLKEE